MAADGRLLLFDGPEDVARFFRIEHTEDDVELHELIEEAESLFQMYTGKPLTTGASSPNFVETHNGGSPRLFLRNYPVKSGSVSIRDLQPTPAEAFDATLYRVDTLSGIVWRTDSLGNRGSWLVWGDGMGRWEVSYDAGLDQHPDWARLKLAVKNSIRQLVGHWYEVGDPALVRESFGGGVSREFLTDVLPPRVRAVWDTLAGV